MANEQNLKPFNKMDPEKARELRVKGAYASQQARLRNKTLREAFKALQEVEIPMKDGGTTTASDAIALALMKKAVNGDLKAIEFLWEALYGKQTKVDVTSSDGSMSPQKVDLGNRSIDELMALVDRMKDGRAGSEN